MSQPAKVIRVWWRTDGEPPCVLQRDKWPRTGGGDVYDVTGAKGRTDAEGLVRRFRQGEPDRRADPQGYLAWLDACDSVKPVDRLDPNPAGADAEER